ncbi:MAG: ABC transporter substrate-binding protein [Flavobacteriaceae bacterium]|nr:ABC transporter substrate-binding protein [Flavobacteriaceae bacterium]
MKYSPLFLIVLFIASCSEENRNKYESKDVFRYNQHTNISSLDPAFAKDQANIWAVNQLFSGLVELDDNLNVEPDIAKSWSVSESGLVYDFHLRDDVYFHKHKSFGKDSTRLVKASDFEYSFDRLLDEKVASPGAWVLQQVSDYKAINDSLFRVELKSEFPAFLGLLTTKYCSVVPVEVVNVLGDEFGLSPIGTGPFKFKLWKYNTKLIFRKNNLYYQKDKKGNSLPYLEAVAISFLPDKQSEFLQFVQGEFDFLSGIAPSYKDNILNVKGELNRKYSDKINLIKTSYLNTEYLGFNMSDTINGKNSIFLRKAINYGFNRRNMIKYLRNNIGIPANNGFIPKGLPSFMKDTMFVYDKVKAISYLNKYKDITGDYEPVITISTNSQYRDICEFIQKELKDIGIVVYIDIMPSSSLRQAKAKGQLSIFRASWIADYPDGENYLSLFYSKNFAPNGPNYTFFKDDFYDELYMKSRKTNDLSERLVLYKKMDSIIMDKSVIVPLYYDEVLRFTSKNIIGLGVNSINILDLKKVRKN